MLFRLLILVGTIPLVELWLLLKIHEHTSVEFTIGLVLLTGIVGSMLARTQGWRTMRKIQQELQHGAMPGESLLDAVMIFVAGALLLTPGVLTDVFGLSLLIPFCRRLYRRALSKYFRARFQIHSTTSTGTSMQGYK